MSFDVAPGEFLAVIGPSGCGKSTLFNIIGGLLGDYEGRVTVAGETVRGPARRDRHGVPGGVDLPVAHRHRECRLPARDRRHGQGAAHRARAAFHRSCRPHRLREALSGRTLRRHAPARRDRAHARLRAEDPADGRAVRRARRADAAAARRQGAADPGPAEADLPAHHPQHHRSRAARRPRAGDDLPARQGETHGGDRAAAPALLRDRVERCVRPHYVAQIWGDLREEASRGMRDDERQIAGRT